MCKINTEKQEFQTSTAHYWSIHRLYPLISADTTGELKDSPNTSWVKRRGQVASASKPTCRQTRSHLEAI